MIYTNKKNLSQEIYDAIVSRQNKYDPNVAGLEAADYSVTEILNSPRIVHLTKRHYDEMEVDVSDLFDSWMGHLMHDALETDETAKRLQWTNDRGTKLSGAYDYYKDGILKDYKRTSAWTVIYGSMVEKWEAQLNIYAWLLRLHNKPVKSLGIEVFLKDWKEFDAMRLPDYPKQSQFYIPMDRWTFEDTSDYVDDCLVRLEGTKDVPDEDLPHCTEKDMWAKDNVYAVMKDGRKKAVRLFDTHKEAALYIAENGFQNHTITTRPGERTRCQKFCNCSSFCNQWKDYCAKVQGT